jgi:hypothetical protein
MSDPAIGFASGRHLAEVRWLEQRNNRTQVLLRFVAVGCGNKTLCFDLLQLRGDSRAVSIALKKLLALGVQRGSGVDINFVLGRRVWLNLKHEIYRGNTQLKVDIYKSELAGYEAADPSSQLAATTAEPKAMDVHEPRMPSANSPTRVIEHDLFDSREVDDAH